MNSDKHLPISIFDHDITLSNVESVSVLCSWMIFGQLGLAHKSSYRKNSYHTLDYNDRMSIYSTFMNILCLKKKTLKSLCIAGIRMNMIPTLYKVLVSS